MSKSTQLDDMAYQRGLNDARSGKPRFPRSQHPDQYSAYNAGYQSQQKLSAYPDMLEALRACQVALCDKWSPRDKAALAKVNASLAMIDAG